MSCGQGTMLQTLCCGGSILGWSVSLGFNDQPTSLTIELVQDPCVGTKVWWDENLNRHQADIADPGFNFPLPGTPVFFKVEENIAASTAAERGGFEYCGLVQSWTEKTDMAGNPAYSIIISDPRSILDNCHVIIGDYTGASNQVWNTINVYGFLSNYGSYPNKNGMQWNDIKCGLQTLTAASIITNEIEKYCRAGRLVNIGNRPDQAGYGVLGPDDAVTDLALLQEPNSTPYYNTYLLDVTDIPFSSTFYRLDGNVLSLTDLLNRVTDDISCDYFVELLPIRAGGGIQKIIKVRCISRANSRSFGQIADYVKLRKQNYPEANGGIISYTQGLETYNDPTSVYLLGGKQRFPYVVNSGDIHQYWGLNSDNTLTEAKQSGSQLIVNLDTARINPQLNFPFENSRVWVTEAEIRAAMYDVDSFTDVSHIYGLDISRKLKSLGYSGYINMSGLAKMSGPNSGNPFDIPVPVIESGFPDQDIFDKRRFDFESIYGWLREFGNTYYGKQYLVNITGICYAYDSNIRQYNYSHLPSVEGAWVETSGQYLLGINHGASGSWKMRDDDGKYYAMIGLNSGQYIRGSGIAAPDLSKFSNDSRLDVDNGVVLKADIDPYIIHGIPTGVNENTTSVVLKLETPLLAKLTEKTNLESSVGLIDEVSGVITGNVRIDFPSDHRYGMAQKALVPSGAVIPLVSNINRYGPWGVIGVPGQSKAEIMDDLVPWNYGSIYHMNLAADAIVKTAVSNLQGLERGSVTVTGVPKTLPGGELLLDETSSPPAFYLSQKYLDTRFYQQEACIGSMSYVKVPLFTMSGTYGPNITNINVTWGSNGFLTTYQFSTYAQQYGRFGKKINDTLARLGKDKLRLQKQIDELGRLKQQLAAHKVHDEDKHRVSNRNYKPSVDLFIRETVKGTSSDVTDPYRYSIIPAEEQVNVKNIAGNNIGIDSAFLPASVTLKTPTQTQNGKTFAPRLELYPSINYQYNRNDCSTGVAFNYLGYDSHKPTGDVLYPDISLTFNSKALLKSWGYDLAGNRVPNTPDYLTNEAAWPVGPIDWQSWNRTRYVEHTNNIDYSISDAYRFYLVPSLLDSTTGCIQTSHDKKTRFPDRSPTASFFMSGINNTGYYIQWPKKAFQHIAVAFDAPYVKSAESADTITVEYQPYKHHIWDDYDNYQHLEMTGVTAFTELYDGNLLTGIYPSEWVVFKFSPMGNMKKVLVNDQTTWSNVLLTGITYI